MTTLQAPCTERLGEICALPTEDALPMAAGFLDYLAQDTALLESEILPLLKGTEAAADWYVARRYEEGEDYSMQVFVWPPGTATKIHDHSSWGVYRCVVGSIVEERYQRLDNGSRPDHARLEREWRLTWGLDDGASTVLPGDGGIHRVTNLGDEVAVSVHLYGPRLGEVDGRDYDPSRDHICDRRRD